MASSLQTPKMEQAEVSASRISSLFKANDEGSGLLVSKPAEVLEKGVYRGAHYYSLTPMIRVMLNSTLR